MTRAAPDRRPRQRAPRHPRPETLLRVDAMERLLEQGYTVADAGRELGLSRHLSQDTARRFSLRAFHGAIAEAKSDAGVKGNAARWGA